MPMALESWLSEVRSAMSSARSSSGGSEAPPAGPRTKQSTVGILAFEVASLMSKLLHLCRAVGDAAVARLRHETIHLHGVRKVVSDDDHFLLGLARAELVDTLRAAADSVAALADERDELYGMLTASVRAQLRARLRGVVPAADPGLAGQWRAALAGILEWLAPMAHATLRWQAERSPEQRGPAAARGGSGTGSVLLLQTLQFAERDRVDAAAVELLVGLNYVWRFEKEMMSCRTLFAVHHR
ncbi:unnamed protein product [Miscanthus lutarioriparius]|uniref:DUF668 domain-containing protein n=1 Tax=Miscanthus lutarioriparius TaxID=422564 RepID=A0A811S3A7_9POAL|nr:unnamed protein product [Miscanthus lutarioriparius]